MEGTNGTSDEFNFFHQQAILVKMDAGFMVKTFVVLLLCMSFVAVNSIMFYAVRSKPTFQEESRYILFSQMLVNDSIQLATSAVLYVLGLFFLSIPKFVCSFIVLMSGTTYLNTPLILALMSFERYVAICFPLRHAEITTPRRTAIIIGVVWFLGSINILIDITIAIASNPHSFAREMFCTRERLYVAKWQVDFAQGLNGFFFVAVGVSILYTYTCIMVTAQSINAQKARKTVLLHLFQLGLCLTSVLYAIIEQALAMVSLSLFIHLRYLNFLFILILPRCLSPLIYGLRDEGVRPLFVYYLCCAQRKVHRTVTVH